MVVLGSDEEDCTGGVGQSSVPDSQSGNEDGKNGSRNEDGRDGSGDLCQALEGALALENVASSDRDEKEEEEGDGEGEEEEGEGGEAVG